MTRHVPSMRQSFKSLIVPFSALFIGVMAIAFTVRQFRHEPLERALRAPPRDIEYFVLGYKDMAADIFWLRVIQDFDYCENLKDQQDRTVSPGNGITNGLRCAGVEQGWAFRMLDTVTRLAPKFRVPYVMGGPVLSVLIQDKEGARLLYERGIEQFPESWQLPYYAGYHYLTELNQPERAAELLLKAGERGAPGWVNSLAAKVYGQEGRLELAASVLRNMIEQDPEGRWADHYRDRLKEVEAQVQAPAPAPVQGKDR